MSGAIAPAPGWWRFPLGLFGIHRVALVLFSFFSLMIDPVLERPGGMVPLHAYPALDGFCRWDCGCFAHVSELGYDAPIHTNFWPLFPMAGRALTLVGVPLHFGYLIIANLAGLMAWLFIYRVFLLLDGEERAQWGLVAYAAFPFSFFQASAYPESLMIAFTALAILLALRGAALGAGISLGFAILSRHLGVIAGPALLIAQLRERGLRGFLRSPRVLTLAVPLLIGGLYPLWQWKVFGDPLTFWKVRAQWGDSAWWGVSKLFAADTPPQFNGYAYFAVVPTIGALALGARKRWAELAGFALLMMVVLWSVGAAGMGRYAASCWPAFLPLGVALQRWPALRLPLLMAFGLGQGVFFNLFVHQYPIL